jgi:organic hydroperoxide reductase OsmC/OhrA
VVWRSSNIPTPKEVSRLHHLAHLECFIANSLKSEIIVQPRN